LSSSERLRVRRSRSRSPGVRHRWSDTFRSAPGYTRLFALGWGLRDRKDSYEFPLAQPGQTTQPPPNAVSVEQSAVFDVTPVTGTLKETVQKRQQLVWRTRRSPDERRFELTDMSVALLRNQAPGEVKITFAGHVSALGWRPEGDPKVEVIIGTRGGASIYSWTVGFSVRCADTNRPLPSGAERHRPQSVQQHRHRRDFGIPGAE